MSTSQLAVILFLIVAILVILVILFFGWAVRSGQFKDVEGIKYRMLEDDDAGTVGGALPASGGDEKPGKKGGDGGPVIL